jgi:hypothetical protein
LALHPLTSTSAQKAFKLLPNGRFLTIRFLGRNSATRTKINALPARHARGSVWLSGLGLELRDGLVRKKFDQHSSETAIIAGAIALASWRNSNKTISFFKRS